MEDRGKSQVTCAPFLWLKAEENKQTNKTALASQDQNYIEKKPSNTFCIKKNEMSKRSLLNRSEKNLLQRESPRDILQEDLLHHRKKQQKTLPQNYQFNTRERQLYKTEKV